MLRRMKPDDIPAVAAIHQGSWAPHEISVKLGSEYLKLFYRAVVESPYSFAYVYEASGQIVGYACGFHDYRAFNRSVQSRCWVRLGIILFKRMLALKVSWADISNLLTDEKKLRKARYGKHHLGALALDNEFKGTPLGREAIADAINGVLGEFARRGYPGCCVHCDVRNVPMRKCLLKLGFAEMDTIDFIGRSVMLFEKPLADATGG